jgi:primosomal protein N'
VESTKRIYFRAVREIPGNKKLWLDLARLQEGVLSAHEKQTLIDLMLEKELRIRKSLDGGHLLGEWKEEEEMKEKEGRQEEQKEERNGSAVYLQSRKREEERRIARREAEEEEERRWAARRNSVRERDRDRDRKEMERSIERKERNEGTKKKLKKEDEEATTNLMHEILQFVEKVKKGEPKAYEEEEEEVEEDASKSTLKKPDVWQMDFIPF